MNARDVLKMADVALDGIELIQQLTKVGGEKAAASLAAVGSVVTALIAGFDGKLSPQSVLAHIEVLHDGLRGNDAAADAAVAKKFGGGE